MSFYISDLDVLIDFTALSLDEIRFLND